MSDELPYFSVFVRDALATMAGREAAERGAAWSLMFGLWDAGGVLPFDSRRLARLAGVERSDWEAIWEVIGPDFVVDGDEVRHKTVTAEMTRALGLKQKRRLGAQTTNEKRYGQQTPSDTLSDTPSDSPSDSLSERPAGRSRGRSGVGNPSPSPSPALDLDLDPEAEPKRADPLSARQPPVLVFPASGRIETWDLTESWLAEARKAYPAIDVVADLRIALAKVKTGAVRKPTAKGMPRFLMNWLSRTNDGGRPHSNGQHVEQVATAALVNELPDLPKFTPRPKEPLPVPHGSPAVASSGLGSVAAGGER